MVANVAFAPAPVCSDSMVMTALAAAAASEFDDLIEPVRAPTDAPLTCARKAPSSVVRVMSPVPIAVTVASCPEIGLMLTAPGPVTSNIVWAPVRTTIADPVVLLLRRSRPVPVPALANEIMSPVA